MPASGIASLIRVALALSNKAPPSSLAGLENKSWLYEGVVVREPKLLKKGRAYAWVQLRSIGNDSVSVPRSDRVLLFYLQNQARKLRTRDTIAWDGVLKQVKEKPEMVGYFLWLKRNGIRHQANAANVFSVRRPTDFHGILADLRAKYQKVIHRRIKDTRVAALAEAMLVGARTDLSPELNEAFRQSGLFHLLSLSGSHVAALLALLFAARRLLNWHPAGKAASALLLAALLISFAILTGLSPSVVRAVGMALLYMIARGLGRPPTLLQTLTLATVLHLLWEPPAVLDIGFQLSYSAVLGIALLMPVGRNAAERLWRKFIRNRRGTTARLARKAWLTFNDVAALSIAAQLFTTPLALYYFEYFPTWFLVANLLSWPFTLVALLGGFSMLMLDFIPYAGEMLGYCVEGNLKMLIATAELVSAMPWSQIGPLPLNTSIMIASWSLLSLGAAWLYQRERRFRLSG